MTNTDTVLSAEELDALLAGTEGIEEGPWIVDPRETTTRTGDMWAADGFTSYVDGYGVTSSDGGPVVSPDGIPALEVGERTAAHIARCSPDTIRKLVTEVKASRSHSRASGDGWQDIATAPKDGTPVLVANSNGAVYSAWWEDVGFNTQEAGWADGATNRYEEYVLYQPTHWRPLPAPPEALSQSQEEGL